MIGATFPTHKTIGMTWGGRVSNPYTSVVDPAEQRELATGFAWAMAHTVATDELPYFDEVVADYWSDPAAAVKQDNRGEPIGFGLDAAMTTTVLLAIATPVINSLAEALGTAIKEKVTPKVTGWIRRILGIGPMTADPDPVPRLTPEQLRTIRSVTLNQAVRYGIQGPQAELLADAVVGATTMAAGPTD